MEEPSPDINPENYDEVVGQCDLLLTYLWRVHGIDFYSCYELTASEFSQRLTACRLLRGPQPAELIWDKDAQGRPVSNINLSHFDHVNCIHHS